jgi:hypothetical protein
MENSELESLQGLFDRRRHRRIELDMPCHLSSDAGACISSVRDISVSGVALETTVKLDAGDPVDLLLKIHQNQMHSHVYCSGMVARIVQAEASDYVYGIHVGASPEYTRQVRALDTFLAARPGESAVSL